VVPVGGLEPSLKNIINTCGYVIILVVLFCCSSICSSKSNM